MTDPKQDTLLGQSILRTVKENNVTIVLRFTRCRYLGHAINSLLTSPPEAGATTILLYK